MQELIDFLKLDYIFLVLNLVNIFTFIGFVYLLISNIKLKNKYNIDLNGIFEEEIAKMEEKYDNDSETILA